MLNKVERERVKWAMNALDDALRCDDSTIPGHVDRNRKIHRAKGILKKLIDGDYSSKNY